MELYYLPYTLCIIKLSTVPKDDDEQDACSEFGRPTAPMVWLVQTDGAGYKSFTAYDITPHEEEKPVDNYKSLEERIKKLEEAVNGKPDTTNVKRKSE